MMLQPYVPPSTSVLGMAHIMRLAFRGESLEDLSHACNTRLKNNPADAGAMLDMATILQINQRPDMAWELQSQALQLQQCFELSSNPLSPDLKLLAIMRPGEAMANTPLEFLIESSNISLEMLYLGDGLPAPTSIPDHDVAFMAICESDDSRSLLQQLQSVMEDWPRPVINAPSKIAQLSRDCVAVNLDNLPAIAVSKAERFTASALHQSSVRDDLAYPCIIRPTDSHAGHGLMKIDGPNDLAMYLSAHSNHSYFVSPFIDYRSPDGWFRKYRVVVIDSVPYASHMAISQRWMVHYLNADMLDNPRNRAEEAMFMKDFESHFQRRHANAFQTIQHRIGLDYYSLDCAETQDGRLLVFEIDSGAVVHDMDPIDLFPYKRPQMQKVFAAFHDLLYSRAHIVRRKQLRAA